VARDEARDDSDVDVMVSFLSTPSFTGFMEPFGMRCPSSAGRSPNNLKQRKGAETT
jgi:hypothetical protein